MVMNLLVRTALTAAQNFGYMLPTSCLPTNRSIISVSATDHPVAAFTTDLQRINTELRYLSSIDAVTVYPVSPGHTVEAAVVNIDSFMGRHIWLEALTRVRRSRPDLPIIAVSEQFCYNDFGTTRLFMADVTLSLPLEPASLFAGLLQAAENNLVWQGHQSRRDAYTRRA